MLRSPSRWRVTGASVTGSSHLKHGQACDDASLYQIYGDQLLLLVAADGAGSALHAATGARLAVQATLERAEQLLLPGNTPAEHAQWSAVLASILTFAHTSLLEQAAQPASALSENAQSRPALREFATTLLFAIATPDWLSVAQIGDGAVVIQATDATCTSLTPPRERQFLNETDFLTDTAYQERAIFHILPRQGIQGIALLTDGLELLAMNYPASTPYQPFFTSLFNFASQAANREEELKQFLTSERVCERTDDDKTLLLAVYL